MDGEDEDVVEPADGGRARITMRGLPSTTSLNSFEDDDI